VNPDDIEALRTRLVDMRGHPDIMLVLRAHRLDRGQVAALSRWFLGRRTA